MPVCSRNLMTIFICCWATVRLLAPRQVIHFSLLTCWRRKSTFYLLICVTHILPVIASYFRFNSLHSNAGKLLNPSIPVNNKANIKYRRIRKQIQYYGIASFERLCRKTVSLLDLARLTLFCFWFNALHENEIDCGIKLKLPPGPLVAPKFLSSNFFVDL